MREMNILVCDDDKEIVEAISIYLQQEGYRIFPAYNGEEALKVLRSETIQLAVIDIMMPVMDGIHAVMELRKTSSIPVIMLSAKSEDMDKILGLNVGADDYMTKPFNPLELIARVKSQLRRYTQFGAMTENTPNIVKNGELTLDDEKKQILMYDEPLKLTPTEYKIMRLLMQNVGSVFSSSTIYERIWGDDAFSADNVVSVHIKRIRDKIEIDPKNPRYIKVMWGVGYRMDKLD